ncbi:DUF6115 domain-containing protein [Pseudalkalibacillus caeni]|uniref:Uncharacterized protein n=1 Tax=Exobacillus caeni TaxID=2574798 RepID=A0A5R9F2E7_9BACL|nr:hypothetical protein [Pseudalkalibacillus caeni]TLS36650.1 hypothetical protein FCL54_14105 [Pseudalkalibacillus caeni]
MIYFIVISIVLHLVSLLAIVILFQKQSLSSPGHSMEGNIEGIKESMAGFVKELEQENQLLAEKLIQYIDRKEEALRADFSLSQKDSVAMHDESPIEEQSGSEINDSLQPEEQVIQLYKQGFSSHQIASTLKKGTGEVELIINMYKKRK